MVGARQIRQCKVEKCAWNILWPDESFKGLQGPRILAVLGLGGTYCLENVDLLGTGEVHHDLAVIGPQAKCRVILGLYRSRRFIDFTQTEDVVHGRVQPEAWVHLLLLRRCDLDKLAAYLDYALDLAFCLRESGDGLEDVTSVCNYTDRLLGQVQLTEVEMGLKILETADEVVLDVLRVEYTCFVLGRDTKNTTETFSIVQDQTAMFKEVVEGQSTDRKALFML